MFVPLTLTGGIPGKRSGPLDTLTRQALRLRQERDRGRATCLIILCPLFSSCSSNTAEPWG